MRSIHRGVAAWLLGSVAAFLGSPAVGDAQTTTLTGDGQLTAPKAPFVGWRLGSTLYAGWDSNALDIPDGPSDYDYDLGLDAGWGRQSRFGMFGLGVEGGRRLYAEFDGRNAWRGAGTLSAGRQVSRNAVVTLAAGARYDYTDEFLTVPGVGTQLPRSNAWGTSADGRLDLRLARRTFWTNQARYESLEPEQPVDLPYTRSLRARSTLGGQLARRDELSVVYEFLYSSWGTETADSHAGLLGWTHGFSDRWSVQLEAGVSRLVPPGAVDSGATYPFAGGVALAGDAGRASVRLSYRRGASPGYGTERLLYSDVVEASANVPIGRRLALGVTGGGDRGRDPFDASYRADGAFVDVKLGLSIARRLGLVGSYRYRRREASVDLPVEGHRVGLALTTAFESRRRGGTEEEGRR
jgi:hypothetical protein